MLKQSHRKLIVNAAFAACSGGKMAGSEEDLGRFATRFEQLLDSIRSDSGERYSFPEIAASIKERSGLEVTSSYLSRILSGGIKNPGAKHTAALADFFGVDARFFTSDKVAARGLAEIGILETMRERGMDDIFTRASRLSMESLEALRNQVATLEQLEASWRNAESLRTRPRRRPLRSTQKSTPEGAAGGNAPRKRDAPDTATPEDLGHHK